MYSEHSVMTLSSYDEQVYMYLLRHRCEYTTGIIERGCGRETDKARGAAE